LNRFLAGKAGRWLGQVSYSYYLFHGLVVIAARTTLCHPGFRESVPAPLVLAAGLPLCYAASLAVAAAMHYGLELPLRRMLPGRPGRRAPRLLAPAIPPLSRAAAAGGG
jgi:peptidoglycan/LPS O-acetylase OafA/YrhL